MKALTYFVTKFTSLIADVLSGLDRVRFTGHLPISFCVIIRRMVHGTRLLNLDSPSTIG